ncbi:GGDEF domain-containing protein [Thauera humireducens]|uniref:GGDEF domain-containing protein n=1 Tax=Thauera humireducens TaxID=1134435 RepID=UPI00311F1894
MEASLLHLATSDPLTGLWNRRHFTEVVNGELGRVRRHGVQAGLMLLDLDHFKRINDTRGHAAGDEVLRHFAGIVSRHLREADVFARLRGEEFAVLLPCIDDAAGACVPRNACGNTDREYAGRSSMACRCPSRSGHRRGDAGG